METAVERIVVQATPQEKKAIAAKAKRLGMPISELMRRGASAYQSAQADAELGSLADAARARTQGRLIAVASVMSVTDRVWGALTSMIKLEDKVTRQSEALKAQQTKIENLTERVIRLEAQLELLTTAAMVKKLGRN